MHQTFRCIDPAGCSCPCDRCTAEAHNPGTTEAARAGAIALLANDAERERMSRFQSYEPSIMEFVRNVSRGHLTGAVQRAREILVDVEFGGGAAR